MSLAANVSQGRINHLADILIQSLQNEVPALTRGAIITARLIEQVREIVRKNIKLLGGAFLTAGLLTILPSLLVTAVHVLGFTAGGILKGSIAALIQSFGATAVMAPPVAIGLGVTMIVIGAGILGYSLWSRHSERRRIDRNSGNLGPNDNDDDSDSNPHRKHSSSLQIIKSPRQ